MVDHFLAAFLQLEGTSVREKRMTLFKLLEQKPWTRDEIQQIVNGLVPQTHLEKIFHVETLIFFRHFDALYKVFTSGEGLLASKISKQAWFFDRIFDNLSPKDFVDGALPTLSVSVRLKLVRKLRTSEEICDQMFENLTKKYGLMFACNILDRCSVSKIETVLKSYPVKLSVGQLRVVYQKSPSLIGLYLDGVIKVDGEADNVLDRYSSLFVWIAERNADDFCNLQKKYKIKGIKLGKRTSKRFVCLKKDEVLTEPTDYMRILKSSVAVRKLGRDFKQVYLKLAKDDEYKEYERTFLLSKYAKNGRFALFKSVYDQIYHKKIDEKNLDAITEDILGMIQDPVERQKWAKMKYDKDDNEEYLKYYRAEDCFDILIGKFNSASRGQRASYVKIMVECCMLNENLDVLLKVAKLIAGRLKNDDASVHLTIIAAIEDSKITDKLSEDHWKILEEIFAIMEVKDEITWHTKRMQHKYMKYLFDNGKPIGEHVLKYKIDDDSVCYDHFLPEDSAKYRKAYFTALIETAPERFSKKEKLDEFDLAVIDVVRVHNRKYPNEMIDIYHYPRLIESAKSFLERHNEQYWGHLGPSFAYVAGSFYKGRSEIDEQYRQMYFSKYQVLGNEEIVLWYLKYNPKIIQEHFDKILETIDNDRAYHITNLEIWKSVRNYSHLNLDKKTVEFLLDRLPDKEFAKQNLAIKVLSLLMSPAEYKTLAATYKSSSIDDKSFKVRGKMLKNFRNLRLPEDVLPTLAESCTSGDFLINCLQPLYSSMCRTPQDQALHHIKQFDQSKALSVKKHTLFLTIETQDQNTVVKAFKNASFPSLLYTLLKYLKKNPNEDLWELFQSRIVQVPEKDVQLLESLLQLNLPLTYKAKTIELLWTVIVKYQNKKLKKSFVAKLKKADIKVMGLEVCKNIIQDSFFQTGESEVQIDNSAVLFTANFLVFHADPAKFDIVFDVLRTKKQQIETCKANNSSYHEKRTRKTINALVKSIYNIYMKTPDASQEFAEQFVAKFNQLFTPADAFEEYVLSSMMELKSKKDEAAEVILAWNRRLVETYGEFILGIFAGTVKDGIAHLFQANVDRIKFCWDLLAKKQNVEDALLVIRLLPESVPTDFDGAKYFNDSVAVLRKVPDKIVQLQLNFYLRLDNKK